MKIVIINSTNHWKLGWAIEPHTQQPVLDSLQRAGIAVDVYQVTTEIELQEVIKQVKQQPCLVWANAYKVESSTEGDEPIWISDILEQHQLATIGSGSQALQNVLLKHQCQDILTKAGISVPFFASIHPSDLNTLERTLTSNQLEFPLFVKPDSLSSSIGISQECIVNDIATLKRQIKHIGDNYGYPVMVEEFLPGDDVTVAVFNTGNEQLTLATYYTTDHHQADHSVLDRNDRLQNWSDSKQMRVVTEPEIIAQIPGVVLPICAAVGITDVTRIDCRLDRNGKLKAFDVNGLPGLEYPDSVTVWQFITKFNEMTWLQAFDVLIYSVIYCAAKRYKMDIPQSIENLVRQNIDKFSVHPTITDATELKLA